MSERMYYGIEFQEGTLTIVAKLSRYGFTPPGNLERWLRIVRRQAEKRNAKKFILLLELQDKYTGHVTKKKSFEADVDDGKEKILFISDF